jgi:hypothetical protein
MFDSKSVEAEGRRDMKVIDEFRLLRGRSNPKYICFATNDSVSPPFAIDAYRQALAPFAEI